MKKRHVSTIATLAIIGVVLYLLNRLASVGTTTLTRVGGLSWDSLSTSVKGAILGSRRPDVNRTEGFTNVPANTVIPAPLSSAVMSDASLSTVVTASVVSDQVAQTAQAVDAVINTVDGQPSSPLKYRLPLSRVYDFRTKSIPSDFVFYDPAVASPLN